MADMVIKHLDDARELAAILQPTHAPGIAELYRSGVPLNAGDGEGGAGDGEGGDGEGGDGEGGAGDGEPAGGTVDHEAEAKKWKALARKHENDAKSKGKKLQTFEDASKSETERAAEAKAAAEARATTAETTALRLEVAMDKAPEGMPIKQVRKLAKRLAGTTQEEIEADADELFADFTPDTGGSDRDRDKDPRRRPKERLRPGAAPPDSDDDGETDPIKLAAKVPRPY